jgi:hypothetical protein
LEGVQAGAWFAAPNHGEARDWLHKCEALLEEFEAKVFELQGGHGDVDGRSHLRALPEIDAG